ncbi:MAG: carboxypeptidase regulatory-like domain-containing protein [Acidobacteria bacterium]|uniref:Carboxypeptidase regulatory-like domain-containing protein n=1 Tax=Candidatus Polarisedimenticola svalbardensis TaxID=2886004 RepID=A0A8J6Y3F3_9BACT|nr:carboxypeptidase regulatory-like domain-containing protein [Candidatus Polarisedimenticola svalbardensis]
MNSNRTRRILGTVLAVTLVLFAVPSTSLAGTAVFQGKVVAEDGITPIEGVVVRLGVEETGTTYNSEPTNGYGAFRLESAPAGSYAVLAQRGDVGFLTAENITLADGENAPVSIVISTAVELAPAQTTASELPMWGKIGIGATIAVLTWAIFEDTSEEGADSATPF